ncbi:MAG: flagellin [Hyphomicrobiaceae bacterium]|jgi:flagellin|nr:flagellin [Hyphomicrobiaceae bacterium]
MANSIKTNFAAMTALQSLNTTNKNLEKTQNTISTGFKVNEAADNAAYWAIATTLRSDTSALSTVQDSLGLGAGQVDVAYTAVNNAIEIVKQIRDKLASARQDTVDKKLVQTDIDALQEQLVSVANAASYSGQNWLVSDSAASAVGTAQIVSSYSRNAAGSANIATIDVALAGIRLFHNSVGGGTTSVLGTVYAIDVSAMTSGQIQSEMDKAAAAITSLTTVATTLGSVKSRISIQQTFVKDLRDAIGRGISSLVDADMNEQSTKLQALQVQQQLGVQALSIANQSSQSILRLFQ